MQELETLLQDAVARQMVADVQIGILLSGGVDSSLLTALAVRTSSRVKTFTIRFPGHGNYDETPHARLIADHFRTDHVELEASDTSVDLLPRLARQFDEPMSDSSMVPTFLISQEIRRHCTVAIGGDGGDELFGGYAHYDHILRQESRLARLPGFVRRGVAAGAAQFLPTGYRGRNYLRGYGMRLGSGQLPLALFDAVSRRKLLRGMPGWEFGAEAKRERIDGVSLDLVQRMTRSDFRQYLPEDILVKVDRASMLNSLEVRAPFLDYRLIDFAFGRVPSDLKTSGDNRKILLKLLARRLLPEGFDLKRKQGFSIPLASWLEAPAYRDYFRDILLGASDSPFDRRYVKSLLAGQAKGRSNSERLFNLLMFELWRTEYGAIVR